MKVIQINCTNGGSVGKIMRSISDGLSAAGHESIICYSLGSSDEKRKNEYKVSGRIEPGISHRMSYITGYPYGGAFFSTKKIIKIIEKEKPDIVHLHCPNNNMNVYRLLKYIKTRRIPLVITNHCEMFYTGNCPHSIFCQKWNAGCGHCEDLKTRMGPYLYDGTRKSWNRMFEALQGHQNLCVTSVSKWVYERSADSKMLGSYPNFIVENGINTDIYKCSDKDSDTIKKKYGISLSKKIVLFVTARFSVNPADLKGGFYFVQLAEKMKANKDLEFVLVGSSKIEEPLPEDIHVIGRVESEDELKDLYSASDLSIVVSKKETFSMPCAESLCCGTPVVGFKAGGPESISLGDYSEFCEFGDINTLSRIIEKWINFKSFCSAKQISEAAKDRYNMDRMNKQYIRIYQRVLGEVE